MAFYKKKPVTVEAIQWTLHNQDEIQNFAGVQVEFVNGQLIVLTREGALNASENDFIIKGIMGEFYPCKPDIFEATYDLVTEQDAAVDIATDGSAANESGANAPEANQEENQDSPLKAA